MADVADALLPSRPTMAAVRNKLKAARIAIGKGDFSAAQEASLEILEEDPSNYNAFVRSLIYPEPVTHIRALSNVFLGLASLELGQQDKSEQVFGLPSSRSASAETRVGVSQSDPIRCDVSFGMAGKSLIYGSVYYWLISCFYRVYPSFMREQESGTNMLKVWIVWHTYLPKGAAISFAIWRRC